MPTVFSFKKDNISQVLEILNKAKLEEELNEKELKELMQCFNNSLVGASKLLHFICPDKYAIWDSRVYRFLFEQEPYIYRTSNIISYLDYLKMCSEVTSHSKYQKIHEILEKGISQKISKMRSIELIFYSNGSKQK